MQRMSLAYEGPVAVLKFNHPEVMNAVGGEMLTDFADALMDIRESDARALLLTGEGRGFCAGANLSDGDRGAADKRTRSGDGLRDRYHPILLKLRDLPMPIVTAVNGAAAGVGMSFGVMGDIVCASKNAFFLQAFTRIGLVPDGGSTFLLPRLIGWGRAMELSLLAERLPAEKALEWGLINRLYDTPEELASGAMEIATKLANGPRSLAMTRQLYWQSVHNSYEQQLDLEARTQNDAGVTRDFKEGVSAFLEKRDAVFKGE